MFLLVELGLSRTDLVGYLAMPRNTRGSSSDLSNLTPFAEEVQVGDASSLTPQRSALALAPRSSSSSDESICAGLEADEAPQELELRVFRGIAPPSRVSFIHASPGTWSQFGPNPA